MLRTGTRVAAQDSNLRRAARRTDNPATRTRRIGRRRSFAMLRSLTAAVLALVLASCASLNTVDNEVSTYGAWPAERQAGSFVFERLPSQQAHPERVQQVEDAARAALEAAGFRAVADPSAADYLVQLGARVISTDPWIYNDPLFWRGLPHRRWHRGAFWGPGWGPGWWSDPYYVSPRFEREVVLLIRDRRTGQLLYEARASNSGPSSAIDYLLPSMFTAALKDFPATGPNPRQVTTQISQRAPD
jgi:hypothetical protein